MDRKALIKLYLGVTEVSEKITISEVFPYTLTLNNDYPGQNYFYIHNNIDEDFQLDVNVVVGEIDIFINIKEIIQKQIKSLNLTDSDIELKRDGSLIYKTHINEKSESVVVDKKYFQEYNFDENERIKIYFYIGRSRTSVEDDINCNYSITQKSFETKEEL